MKLAVDVVSPEMDMAGEQKEGEKNLLLRPRGNRRGRVETVSWEGGSGVLKVYLPYGYRETRSVPYRVWYVSEEEGERLSAGEEEFLNLLDNLIALGRIEPVLAVLPGENPREDGALRGLIEEHYHALGEWKPGRGKEEGETEEERGEKTAEGQDDFDFTPFPKGCTILEGEDSPTGFWGVFVYEEQGEYEGLTGEVKKVDFFSNTMTLFSHDTMRAGTPLDPTYAYYPEDYRPGLLPAGGDTNAALCNGKVNYYAPMRRFAPGLWGVKVPVFSGAYDYNFQLFDAEGNESTGSFGYLFDPHNPPLRNATGDYDRSSIFYVPYKAETMGEGRWIDRSFCLPRKDGRTGRLLFDTYESRNGTRDLGIYLPYGYDPKREEPYRVLYLSHGQQKELDGTEMRWLGECAAVHIMDNLEGDFLLVTMNNKDLDWEEESIWEEMQNILAHMEKHYHVGKRPEDRAFAGFSMGGFTTERIYLTHPECFGYFGIWSAGMASLVEEMEEGARRALSSMPCRVQLGAGDWDYCLRGSFGVRDLYEKLYCIGVKAEWVSVPASHDWCCWQLLLAEAVRGFFWK